MHDTIRSEGSNALSLDWLATRGLAFSHPNEVLDHPALTDADRRTILSSWASDARAVEGAHLMRRLDNGSLATLEEVLRALRKLDACVAPRGRGSSGRYGRGAMDLRKYAASPALCPHGGARR